MDSDQRAYLIVGDVGNSRVKFGLFRVNAPVSDEIHSQTLDAPSVQGPAVSVPGVQVPASPVANSATSDAAHHLPKCLQSTVFAREDVIAWRQLHDWIPTGSPANIHSVIAGTNPAKVDDILQHWPADLCPPPTVIRAVPASAINIDVKEPQKVGIDRLLNAVAANRLRPPHRPAIIVDSGTATTVDLVSAAGEFCGGAILPGFEMAARSLNRYTALLPLVTITELAAAKQEPLGRNTHEALISGIFWGQLGAVKELTARLSEVAALREVNQNSPDNPADPATADGPTTSTDNTASPYLILTGGGAKLLAPHFPNCQCEPHLALQGLALVAQ